MIYKSVHYRNMNDHIAHTSGLSVSPMTSVSGTAQVISQFTDINDIKLPLLIRGRLLTSGFYREVGFKQVYLSPEVLKSTVNSWVGISLYTNHDIYEKIRKNEPVSVNEVVGKIVNTSWNQSDKGIDFEAEIYDLQIAYKMVKGVINSVSTGFGRDIVNNSGTYEYRNMEPVEVSLVFNPRDTNARFETVIG